MNIRKIENGFTISFCEGGDNEWDAKEKIYAFATWSAAIDWLKDNEDKV